MNTAVGAAPYCFVHAELSSSELARVVSRCDRNSFRSYSSQVVLEVEQCFPTAKVANNDEADGVVLAAIGRYLAGCSIEPVPLPATHLSVDRLFEPLPVTELASATEQGEAVALLSRAS